MSIQPYLTIDEQINLPSAVLPNVLQTAISPTGRYIAYTRYAYLQGDNKRKTVTYCHDTATAQTAQITSDDKQSRSVSWAHDETGFYFLSDIQPKVQVYFWSVLTHEITCITDVDRGIQQYGLSADGNLVYYTAMIPQPHITNRDEQYGLFEFVGDEFARNALFVFNRAENITTMLLQPDFFIGQFDVSARYIAICGAKDTGRLYRDYQTLYVLDKTSLTLQTIDTPPISLLHTIHLSPDGESVCFTWYPEGKFFKNSHLDILHIPTMNRQSVPNSLDQDIYVSAWHPKGILATYIDGTHQHIILMQPNGTMQQLTQDPVCFASAPSLSPDGAHIAYAKATDTYTVEIFYDDSPITSLSDALKSKSLARKLVIQWQSDDGLQIEGILHLPHDFDATRRYPLLVIAHGGPKGTLPLARIFQEFYPTEQFLAKGFILLEPNYRGSDGYGEAHRCANIGQLGIGDYQDVISGVDWLIEQGYADPDKIGIMGWSHGGLIAAFCSAYSNRFKVASVGAGISNWHTKAITSDNAIADSQYMGDITAWDDPDKYARASPVTYLHKTPTLIQHGEIDIRVPVTNAYELYHKLKHNQTPVTFILLKGVGHAPDDKRTVKAMMEQNLAWFCHYLLGEPLEGDFWKIGYNRE